VKKRVLFRILALLLGIIGLAMLPSLALAAADGDADSFRAFAWPIGASALAAAAAFWLGRRTPIRLTARDGFLLVALAWVAAAFFGAVPYLLSGAIPNLADAFFETMSGLTTTGASILADVEALPRAVHFWRGMTHWLGGMGIVLLTVALLPLLGVGGFQLVKAETPGPEKDKILPTITATAKILWLIYVGLTALQTVLLMAGGMDWFDAVYHSFASMATGGFSTRNKSVGYYDSAWIDYVCGVFMFLAGGNFSLYYRVLKGKWRDLVTNTEMRVYLGIVLAATLAIALSILPQYGSFAQAWRFSFFQVSSIVTTTGFVTADFDQWHGLAKFVLLILMFIGGCSGSTAGGIKVIRHVVLAKQAGNEMRRMIYPRGVFAIRLNGKVGRKDVVYGVAGFVFVYLALVFVVSLVVASTNASLMTSLSAALATLGNIGPGFDAVGPTLNYSLFPDYVKWTLAFAMFAGRLELWTVFLLFKPEFWRR
jgi:trk system potassium uptake protein TrkH